MRLHVRGELDMANAFQLTQAVIVAAEGGARTVVLGLSDVLYMDSTGVRALIDAHAAVDAELRISRPSPPARRVLELTGLLDRFPLVDGEADAG